LDAQDLAAIASMHDDAIVFHNHTTDERVAAAAAVLAHIGAIFARWPEAVDIPGDKIDQDCSGADAARPHVTARVTVFRRVKRRIAKVNA
jgi:hypothetical protein